MALLEIPWQLQRRKWDDSKDAVVDYSSFVAAALAKHSTRSFPTYGAPAGVILMCYIASFTKLEAKLSSSHV